MLIGTGGQPVWQASFNPWPVLCTLDTKVVQYNGKKLNV